MSVPSTRIRRVIGPRCFLLITLLISIGVFPLQALPSSTDDGHSLSVRVFRTTHFSFTYRPQDQRPLQSLFRGAEDILEKIRNHLPPSPPHLIQVMIASSNKEFRQLQPGPKVPAWVLAIAYPQRGIILMKAPRIITQGHPDLLKTFRHELTHILLGRAFGSRPIPRWLQEGMAQLMEETWNFNRITVMTRAVLADELIPLWDMSDSFPADLHKAEVAYAESYYFLSFILNKFGRRALQNFIGEISQGVDLDVAISRATEMRLREVIQLWERYIKLRFNWIPIITGGGAMWFVASSVLVIGYLVKRRRARRLLRQWELEDAMLTPITEVYHPSTQDRVDKI
ncbi:MAG: hypothetical protein JRG73_16885 [Deltaproteobacteria bacterium]|nr:hypothetical protein [Deltaproteobacteria bacterium]